MLCILFWHPCLTAALSGGLAAGLTALASPRAASAGEVSGYPPPPPVTSPIEGAIDFHVHSSPDVFGRAVSDIEAAQAAVAAKMRAVVLKNKVIARENLVLHTGHLSPEEILALIKRGRELGVMNIVVTHAMAEAPGMSIPQMQEAAQGGAYLELIYLSALLGPQAHMAWMRESKGVSMRDMAAAVKAVGAQHCILSTDLGQSGNPIHPDGYKLLVAGLKAEGISQEEIEVMMKRNPGKLLGLEA
jgi:hypothetical protein